MTRTCAWCGIDMGTKPGEGETHGMCSACETKIRKKYGLPAIREHAEESEPVDSDDFRLLNIKNRTRRIDQDLIVDVAPDGETLHWMTKTLDELVERQLAVTYAVGQITKRIDAVTDKVLRK